MLTTDDQALSLEAGNILTLEDGGTVDLTPYLDNTDNQQITTFSLDGATNVLTLTLEDGGTQTVDLSNISTDDQTATEVAVTDAAGNFTSTDVEGALAELATGSTDDQALSLAAGNILTLEDGGTVDLTPYLDNTDNQQITTFSLDGATNVLTLTLEDGGTQTVDLSNISTDDQTATEVAVTDAAGNFTSTDVEGALAELATGSTDDQALSLAAGNILTLEDGGTVDLTPYLDNTDNQQITAFSLDNATNIVTLTLEDGGTQTVDLSGVSTDDQTATEVAVTDAAGNFTATDVEGALAELATGSTDDQALTLAAGNILTLEDGGTVDLTPYLDNTDNQQITAFSLDGATNVLTLTLEDGGTQTVDLSNISTDDQALTLATGNILTLEDGGTVDLTPYLDNTDDQQITAFSLDNATNIVTLTLEDGGTQTVDLSNISTDDQTATEVAVTDAVGNFTSTDVEGALAELATGSTDDQALSLAAGNILTLEDGGTVDLTPYLDNTDDQTATEVAVTDAAGNFTSTDVEGALAELATGSTDDQALSLAAGNILTLEDGGTVDLTPYLDNTDDQQITAFSLDGATNVLTLTLEDGGTQTVDLSNISTDDQTATEVAVTDAAGNFTSTDVEGALAELATGSTDDQTISTDGTSGNLSIENGNAITLNVNDADSVIGNEYNTGSGITAGSVQITDGGGTESVNLISTDANNDISSGTDGALYLNVASVTISETNTTLGFNGATNELTYTNELGNNPVLDLSGINTDDQTATEVAVTDAAGNFTSTDVEGALAELATGSTDDQALSLAAGNILTLEDGGTVDLTPYLDNTDDQQITAFSLDGATNVLTLTLEDGGTQTVDLSGVSTDDQALSLAAGNILTLEDGGTVDLTPYLDNTDNQQITTFSLDGATNVLTLTLEDGGTQTVDLSGVSTDDQTATEVAVTDAAGNFTSTDVEGALAELATGSTDDQALSLAAGNILTLEDGGTVDLTPYLDNTDDQQITAFSLDGTTNVLTLTLEDGGTQTVDLSGVSTDDQALSLAAGNILTLEDGGTVDLTPYLDNTDAQTIGIVNDLIVLGNGTGANTAVDLTPYVNDDTNEIQDADEVNITDAAGNFTATDVEGALAELATGSTDDQALSLAAGNILTLEDGGTVDLTPYLDNTDNQQITAFNLDNATNIVTLTLEDGGTQTIDLSGVSTDDQALSLAAGNILTLEDGGTVDLTPYLDNTDDQTAAEVAIADAGGNFTNNEVEGVLEEIDSRIDALVLAGGSDGNDFVTGGSLSGTDLTLNVPNQIDPVIDLSGLQDGTGTDDQALSLAAGNILTLEDGGTVDLTPYLDNTDNQQITAFSLDNATNIVTLTLEDGGTQTIDLSGVSTDDQALTLAAGNILTLEDGGTVDLTPYLDNTDDQTATEVAVTDAAGNFTSTDVEGALAELATGSTDDQALSLAAGNILTLEDGGTVDLTPYLDNTDNQQITTFSLDGATNVLTLTLEDGGTQTVDLSGVSTDDQTATEVAVTDAAGNFTSTDVEGALAELATGSTDDQALSLAAGNILTLEDGGTVDLTPYLDNTDNQQITAFSLDGATNVLTLTLEDGGTQTVDLSGVSTDDQALSLAAGNILTLEDGGTVDLTPYLDNTDAQTIGIVNDLIVLGNGTGANTAVDLTPYVNDDTNEIQDADEVNITDAAGNFTATDVEGALAELATGSTDDQALSLAAGNILTLEDGGTVDLTPYLDNTDNQQITAFNLDNATNIVTLTLEDGGTQTIDLSGVSTDDQALSLAAGNILTLEDGGTVDLTPYLDNTDDQTAAEVAVADAGGNFTNNEVEGVLEEIDSRIDALVLAGGSDGNDFVTGGSLSGTDLTLNVPNQIDPVIDLSGLQDGTGTDDQALSLAAGNILTLEDGGTVDLTPYLDNTDNQQITAFSLDNATNIVTLTLEDGGTQTIDLSGVSTDDQALTLAAGNILTLEDGGTVDLTPYLDNTDDQTATEVAVTDAAGNFTSTDVEGALAELATGSTDDQALSLAAGNILTLEDGGTVDLTPYLDNTDNQQITTFSLDGATNVLTLTLEDGGTQTIDLSGVSTDDQALTLAAGNILTLEDGGTVDLTPYLDNTDDQTATEVAVTDAAGNFTSTDVEGALAELATGSTDDQALSLAAGNILTLEDGGTVDLTPYLDNTDNQQITTFSLDGATNVLTLTLEDGGTQTVDLSNISTDDQTATEVAVTDAAGNFTSTDVEGALAELATGSTDDQALSLAAGNILTLEDGGTVDLTPYLDNTDAYLDNTDNQQITTFSLDGATNVLTLTLEDGGTQTVDLSGVSTDDQTATEVAVTDAAGNFTSTDVEGALAELATGSTDDQALSLAAGNILTLEDGGTVDLTPYLDNTDAQTIGIVNDLIVLGNGTGANTAVDLTPYVNDDTNEIQDADEVNITDAAGNFTSTDVEGALAELATGSTDDQALTLAAGNVLTLEDGGTVDLTPYLDNTDNQQITTFSLDGATNVLTLTLEDGGTQTVDLSNISTDDQTATEVAVTDAAGNFTSTDVEGALAELATGSTDDQALSLAAGNILTLEDGGTVDLTSYLDNTDNQQITTFSLDGATNVLTLTLEDGGTQTVDLSNISTDDQTATEVAVTDAAGNFTSTDVEGALAELATGSTDDQALSLAAGNILTLEDGGTVDLTPYLDNTDAQTIGIVNDLIVLGNGTGANTAVDLTPYVNDDTNEIQDADEVNITDAAGNFTSTDVEGALAELATGSTDDQALSLAAGNILTLEDGGTVDLTPYLDNTDNQQITTFSLDGATNVLTLTLEDGGTQTVDLSNISTDDQTATEVAVTDAAGNFTSTDVEGALAELATGSTDDQALSLAAGNILTLEDGGTVDLTPYLDNTDNQQITTFSLDGATNVLTLTLEDGGTQTADLSNISTDDQTATEVAVTDAAGNFTSTDVEGALAELATGSTDDQALSLAAGNVLTLEDGGTVDLTPYLDNTDDQQITAFSLDGATNVLTLTLEDGGTQTVDLSGVSTDDQALSLAAGNILTLEDGGTVDLTPYLDNTDNQQITAFSLDGATNVLTLTLEDGGTQTADLSAVSTDDQYDDEVLLRTPIDVDEGELVSPTLETTVEQVIQSIAPITSKAARVFYPPSIEIDASVTGTFTVDLYAQYIAQFGSPVVSSGGTIPTYGSGELDYHVTYADPAVFNTATMAISPAGVLTYTVDALPSDYNTLINVVFVVK